MQGIVFRVLEDVVTSQHGEDAWDDVLERAGTDGAYTAIGSYADAEFLHLLAGVPGTDTADMGNSLRAFGRAALPRLAGSYPQFFTPHTRTIPFLLTLNDIIHPEVRRLYPGADVPVFAVLDAGPDRLALGYRSARRLCRLAEGFIQGAADHYGEPVDISQDDCMLDGAAQCVIVCAFGQDGSDGRR